MNRRKFLLTTTGTFALTNFGGGQNKSFRGIIQKAVKFGSKPNEKRMQELKDLGFDGIEGSAPGLLVKENETGMLKKVKLPMHGVVYNKHWKVRLSDPNPEVRKTSREGLAQAMRDSKGVGGYFRPSRAGSSPRR